MYISKEESRRSRGAEKQEEQGRSWSESRGRNRSRRNTRSMRGAGV